MARSQAFVYLIPDELLPAGADAAELLVTIYEGHAPEVAIRPTINGQALRVWSPPLELVRSER